MPADVDPAAGARRRLTCTIITQNEADRVGRCLASVRGLADEIVVIDSGSTDATLAVCAAHGARCLHNPWQGYGQQKRFAEDQASHDWILNLDADEWLTPGARAEIAAILAEPPAPGIDGYQARIEHVYPGHDRPRFLADYHLYVRLYDRRCCRFPDSAVFDAISLPRDRRARLRHPFHHQSLRSIRHLVRKNVAYYRLQRREVRKNVVLGAVRILVEPVLVFVKYYVFRRHFTGGAYGLALASTIAGLRTYRLMLLMQRPREAPASARAPS